MTNLFVFDTNALISAHIKKNSVSAAAFDHARFTGLVFACTETLHEFGRKFSHMKFKKYMPDEDRAEAILRYRSEVALVEVKHQLKVCRDSDDDKFLSLAVSVNASCLVSGDRLVRELHPFQGIPILSPADFLKLF
jgi:putative PIN family toxin of toxin-antitoxin system